MKRDRFHPGEVPGEGLLVDHGAGDVADVGPDVVDRGLVAGETEGAVSAVGVGDGLEGG